MITNITIKCKYFTCIFKNLSWFIIIFITPIFKFFSNICFAFILYDKNDHLILSKLFSNICIVFILDDNSNQSILSKLLYIMHYTRPNYFVNIYICLYNFCVIYFFYILFYVMNINVTFIFVSFNPMH